MTKSFASSSEYLARPASADSSLQLQSDNVHRIWIDEELRRAFTRGEVKSGKQVTTRSDKHYKHLFFRPEAGNNMRRIADDCNAKARGLRYPDSSLNAWKAAEVRLRGIGSGFLEGSDGKEAAAAKLFILVFATFDARPTCPCS